MALTKEQLEGELTTDPNTATLLVDVLKAREFQVMPKSDYEKFVSDERTRIASDVLKTHLSPIDAAIAEELGITKNGDEKTSDFVKRAAASVKAERTKYADELKTLKDTYKDGADEATRKLLTEAQGKNSTYERDLTAARQELHQHKVTATIERGLSGLKFSGALPESVRETFVQTQIAALRAAADYEGATLVFRDAQKQIILGADGQPATAADLLKERLKDVLDTGKKQDGTGTKPNDDAGNGGGKGADAGDPGTPPATVTSKMALTAWLNERGFVSESKEFGQWFTKYKTRDGKELPLR